jgi:hypothetical protein
MCMEWMHMFIHLSEWFKNLWMDFDEIWHGYYATVGGIYHNSYLLVF